jgi:hypothetical protein
MLSLTLVFEKRGKNFNVKITSHRLNNTCGFWQYIGMGCVMSMYITWSNE